MTSGILRWWHRLLMLLVAVGLIASAAPAQEPQAPLTLAPTVVPGLGPTPGFAPAPSPAAGLAPNLAPATAPATTGGASSITTPLFRVNMSARDPSDRSSVNSALQILVVMTMLTLAPSIIFLMTSFTRIVIVLGFVRNALGVQGAPSNQVIIGLSLFLTMFVMAPVWGEIQKNAYEPYMAEQISPKDALEMAAEPMKKFMLRQTRTSEVEFFLGLAGSGPTTVAELPMNVIIPAFIVSELRTAFQMGLMIFIPFLVIDFIVAAVLMSMGMMMMPPVVVSLPFKLLLFVLINGWHLVVSSLIQSFSV